MAEKNDKRHENSGRQFGQKMKPFWVYQYLMRYSDENHIETAKDICAYLKNTFGISATSRSVYGDIHEINKALLALQEGLSLDEAEERLCEDEEERTIVYDPHKKGYYVRQRRYEASDIRMLAECIYAARFIDEKSAHRLIDVVCDHVSEHVAETIKHDVYLTDRVKTDCKSVYANVSIINDAMSRELNGMKHVPVKIKFKYLKCTIQDVNIRVERRSGAEYVVSPFKLLINDGNYYLLAFDDNSQMMRTFRVDRMKNVCLTKKTRQGEEAFKELNIAAYVQEHFGMFSGAKEHVTLRCKESLLDTIVDRFGTKVIYSRDTDGYFKVVASVAVSEQFFGWVCGFSSGIKIDAPVWVVDEFKSYLDTMREMYL